MSGSSRKQQRVLYRNIALHVRSLVYMLFGIKSLKLFESVNADLKQCDVRNGRYTT